MRQSEVLIRFSKLTDSQKERIQREADDFIAMNEKLSGQRPKFRILFLFDTTVKTSALLNRINRFKRDEFLTIPSIICLKSIHYSVYVVKGTYNNLVSKGIYL